LKRKRFRKPETDQVKDVFFQIKAEYLKQRLYA